MTKPKVGKGVVREPKSSGASVHTSTSFSASPIIKQQSHASKYTAVLQDVKQNALTYPSTLPMPDKNPAHLSGGSSDTCSSSNDSDCGADVIAMSRSTRGHDDDSDVAQLDAEAEEDESEENAGAVQNGDSEHAQSSDAEPEPE